MTLSRLYLIQEKKNKLCSFLASLQVRTGLIWSNSDFKTNVINDAFILSSIKTHHNSYLRMKLLYAKNLLINEVKFVFKRFDVAIKRAPRRKSGKVCNLEQYFKKFTLENLCI